MTTERVHEGGCFCGAVALQLEGSPAGMGYCHCSSCRRWSACPVTAFTLWPRTAVKVTRGADKIGTFAKSPNSVRAWCTACGGHLMTEHPQWGVVDVYAAVIDGLEFTPGVHVNYQETVLRMKDGVAKQRDFPAEMGGSGTAVAD